MVFWSPQWSGYHECAHLPQKPACAFRSQESLSQISVEHGVSHQVLASLSVHPIKQTFSRNNPVWGYYLAIVCPSSASEASTPPPSPTRETFTRGATGGTAPLRAPATEQAASAASVAACAKAAEQLNGEGRVSDGRTSTAATTTAGPRPGRRRRASAPRTSSRSASEDDSSPRRRSRAFTGPESGRERSRGSALYPAEKPRGRAPRSSRAARDDEAPDGFRPSIRVQQNRRRPRPPAEVPRRSDRRARRGALAPRAI